MRLIEVADDKMSTTQLVELIRRRCKPWLEATSNLRTDNHLLWRGIEVPTVGIKEVHVNRRPLNTRDEYHVVADAWFKKKFGHPYRSNAMFAVGDTMNTHTYGSPHLVIPIGNFEVCWSKKVEDMTLELYSKVRGAYKAEGIIGRPTEEFATRIVGEFLDGGKYVEGDLNSLFVDKYVNHERMVKCNEYVAISNRKAEVNTIIDMIRKGK